MLKDLLPYYKIITVIYRILNSRKKKSIQLRID